MRKHTSHQEEANLGKREGLPGPGPRLELFRRSGSLRGDGLDRRSEGALPHGLILREPKLLDFDRLPLNPQLVVDFSRTERQLAYLWSLRSKPAGPLLDFALPISNHTCKPDASSETTARDESGSHTKNAPAASAPQKQPFERKALSQVNYLLKALDFLYYFFKDSLSSQLEEIAKESGLPVTILKGWLEQRDFILETALKLKDSLVRGKK